MLEYAFVLYKKKHLKQETNHMIQVKKQKKLNKDQSAVKISNHKFTSRYAITFGQVSILHLGSQSFGTKAQHGFSVQQLKEIQNAMITQYGIKAQLIDLTAKLPEEFREGHEAAVLYLPGFVDTILGQEGFASKLYEEQDQIEYDKKFYDNRRKKTLNKQARFNIVFGEQERQASQDYKQFSIKAFKNLKYLNKIRGQLGKLFGQKAKNLLAQGNKYYEDKSGIGFHGDSERKIVVCLNLGKTSTLRYFWRIPNSSQNRFGPTDLNVRHGDVYIMSEKASGHDWKLRSKFRLVHAAGSNKYIGQ